MTGEEKKVGRIRIDFQLTFQALEKELIDKKPYCKPTQVD